MSSNPYNPTAPAQERLAQTRGLFTLPLEVKMPLLLPIARTDPAADVRAQAIEGIGRCPGYEAYAALVVALDDPAWHVRAQAAMSLGERRDPGAVAALLHALWTEDDKLDADDKEFNRAPKQMAEALVAIGGTAVVSGLTRLLLSKRPTRLHAANALGVLADPRAFDALCTALTLPPVTRWDYVEIVLGLTALGDPRAIAVLETFLTRSTDPKDYAFQRAQELAREGVASLREAQVQQNGIGTDEAILNRAFHKSNTQPVPWLAYVKRHFQSEFDWEIRDRMPLCGGEIASLWPDHPIVLYPEPHHKYPRPCAIFRDQTQERFILVLAQLRGLIREQDCNIELWVRGHEIQFARILLALLDGGSLVDSVSHYSFLEHQGFAPAQNQPRLEGQILRFCYNGWQTDPDEFDPTIVDVSFDLSSLECTSAIIFGKSSAYGNLSNETDD